jgi:cyclase
MANARLIARLDIKGPNLIKSIRLEGVRVVGNPNEFARRYYAAGADELLYMDAVASLYGRNSLENFIRDAVQDVFIPITVGGGVRSPADVERLLHAGADKVAVNTGAVARPGLIDDIARRFGSQCMVLQIDAKTVGPGKWEVYVDGGREKTGRDVENWVHEGIERGAGEILLTSVDQEGTRKGMDTDLINMVASASSVPVIASGGVGTPEHIAAAFLQGNVSAVAMADILHYQRATLPQIRAAVSAAGIKLRKVELS